MKISLLKFVNGVERNRIMKNSAVKVYKIKKIYTDSSNSDVAGFEYSVEWKWNNVFPHLLKFWWSSLGYYSTFEEAFSKIPNK